jgi:hypothetical protein
LIGYEMDFKPMLCLQGVLPPEISLEPVDVEQLYDSMHSALQLQPQAETAKTSEAAAWRAEAAAELAALEPEHYFTQPDTDSGIAAGPFLSRGRVRRYEAALIGLLLRWGGAARPAGRAATAAVLAAVRERAFEPPPEHVAELAGGEGVAGLVFVLLRLKLLPVIVFNFDRHLCQRLAEALVGYLEVCNTYFEGALQLVVSCNTLGRARWPAACAYHVGCWHQRVYSPNPALPLPSQRCEAEFLSNNESYYTELRNKAERSAKAAKARRDDKPDKIQGEQGGEYEADAGGYDPDAVVPEFSLAGAPPAGAYCQAPHTRHPACPQKRPCRAAPQPSGRVPAPVPSRQAQGPLPCGGGGADC